MKRLFVVSGDYHSIDIQLINATKSCSAAPQGSKYTDFFLSLSFFFVLSFGAFYWSGKINSTSNKNLFTYHPIGSQENVSKQKQPREKNFCVLWALSDGSAEFVKVGVKYFLTTCHKSISIVWNGGLRVMNGLREFVWESSTNYRFQGLSSLGLILKITPCRMAVIIIQTVRVGTFISVQLMNKFEIHL